MEPTERNIKTKVMPQLISVFVLPKSLAKSETVRETVKELAAVYATTAEPGLSQGDGSLRRKETCKEVKSVGRPGGKGNEEESPLPATNRSKQLDRVRRLCHRRLQTAKSGLQVGPRRHAMMRGMVLRKLVMLLGGRKPMAVRLLRICHRLSLMRWTVLRQSSA